VIILGSSFLLFSKKILFMGQKIHPVALRLSLNRNFDSSWYQDESKYTNLLHQDLFVRDFLKAVLKSSGIHLGRVCVQVFPKKFVIHSFLSRENTSRNFSAKSSKTFSVSQKSKLPSFQNFLFKKFEKSQSSLLLRFFLLEWKQKLNSGAPGHSRLLHSFSSLGLFAHATGLLENQRNQSHAPSFLGVGIKFHQNLGTETKILPQKIESKYLSAHFLCAFLCQRLQEGISFRFLSQQIVQEAKNHPKIQGFRLLCSGRLGGAEMARVESKKYGQTSLHVFSEHIDYACSESLTQSGLLGIKVWISYRPEV
jgi:ribosomal protein S3